MMIISYHDSKLCQHLYNVTLCNPDNNYNDTFENQPIEHLACHIPDYKGSHHVILILTATSDGSDGATTDILSRKTTHHTSQLSP